ncbi:tectonic-like complex member MKS1 [Liolophura sinensis]|uniref:tectonic-like complex member MKS1 n=1 Tax=Liolophura sinensis TaxID=3198878 RepID=UPI0031585AF8
MADLYEPDFGTAYYRSKDPVKNLKLRVKLVRITSSSAVPAAGQQDGGGSVELQTISQSPKKTRDAEEYTFTWQEKVFSPREIELYSDPQNCFSVMEKKYCNDIKNILEKGKPTNRLFSYVAYDKYVSSDEAIQYMTTSASEKPTAVAEKMIQARRRKMGGPKRQSEASGIPRTNIIDLEPSQDLKRKNHFMAAPVQTMFIMADCSPTERPAEASDEIVVCSIQIDANGVLAIRPDFNKGRKPYVIETTGLGRDVYEFSIEHASKSISRQEQDRENRMYRELYSRHTEFLQACVGFEFEMPPPEVLRLAVHGEIESARNFEYDDLYLHFFLDLPKNWTADPHQQLSWVTQTCKTRIEGRDDVAYFSFPFDFELFYKQDSVREENKDEMPHLPCVLIEVLSLDSWNRFRTEGYTYINVPSTPGVSTHTLHCWRPIGNSVTSELRRFFIGGSPELEDPTYAAVPTTFDGQLLGKYGFRTETTGSVSVRLNTIFQARAFLERRASKRSLGSLLDTLGINAVQSNISNVLDAFKRARQRMIQARENATHDLMNETKDKNV